MPFNTLEYAQLFQTETDKQVVQQATSGWMEANAGQVIYNGGNEIKIPDLNMQGLADYDRDNGYVKGSVSFKYTTYEMTQDRGRSFTLDAMDVNETNFGATAASVLSEFQRTKVIPEIDAYRYSKIAATAIAAGQTKGYVLNESTVISELYSQIYKLCDLGLDMSQLVIPISYDAYGVLNGSEKIQKKIDVGQFAQGGINLSIKYLDGIPLIPVAANRFKTEYLFNNGKTSGQEVGGFTPTANAKDILWMVVNRSAPVAISKTDTPRIFDPLTNQEANAWKIDYRKYHDAFIPKNKVPTIFVTTKGE
ncbi:hypothetical protein QYF50_15500 [Paenibacillus vini]|uniref:hypothetical protein n=1 Tax=Paenibacillus vini TaxID=1476024 RepID=UPI0025B689E7|nr:hypothetical protein [Paenibacillus vini]MDN4069257.1 hypothetical protein [Paenibacillus vini]MDN4069310.1 hypothetical protein [Paenibacillus vini]